MFKKAAIVYCSPGWSTRYVAQVIEKEIEHAGITVLSTDLGKSDDISSLIKEIGNGKICLFIGSPVYVNYPVPPVMHFISYLPESEDVCAVPFVTWGGSSSGIALYDMGKALSDKGFSLIGDGKVLTRHSLMWRSKNPLGEGHPDQEDERLIRTLVSGVLKKKAAGSPETIALSDLAYQPEEVYAKMGKMTLEIAKEQMPKKMIQEELCTECRICEKICPVQAITLSPYPKIGENCIYCFQCVRNCPENAVSADLT